MPMSKNTGKAPAFQFYAADFLTDTMDWTDEEVGVHIRLLAWSWVNRRGIPREDRGVHPRVTRIAPGVAAAWPTISAKWEEGPDGTWINPRLESTRSENDKFRERQRVKALKAVEARQEREPTGAPTGHPRVTLREGDPIEDEGEDEVLKKEGKERAGEKFEVFWDLYGKKVGRHKAEQKWHRLKPEEQEQVLEHVPAYVSSTPEVKFRKDPSTYLNGRCWEDEIINRTDEGSRNWQIGSDGKRHWNPRI